MSISSAAFLIRAKCRFHCGIEITDKRHHRPVRARPGIDIEQRNAIDRLNRIGNLPNDILVASLRKIRHAFD